MASGVAFRDFWRSANLPCVFYLKNENLIFGFISIALEVNVKAEFCNGES